MKKIISLLLAVVVSISVFSIPVYALTDHVNAGDVVNFHGATSNNAFSDLLNWTGMIFGDVTNLIDVEGTLAVGGNFTSSTGFSVNSGAYGANPASTEDCAFLVNGNVNITGYGSVYGQTVIGNADGNTYHLNNITPSGTTMGQYTVADSLDYFVDAMATTYAVKNTIEALPVNGVCEAAYDTYTFVGNPDEEVLVYNVDNANFPSYVFDFTIEEGQTIIVNLTASENITMRYGGYMINGRNDPDYLRNFCRNIIINVVAAPEIEMNSCELYGILLAPDTDLRGAGSNVCGTSILGSLTATRGYEFHLGYNDNFIPSIPSVSVPGGDPADETDPAVIEPDPDEPTGTTAVIRIDAPRKMAVAFADGTVCYTGDTMEFTVGEEYLFQMCSVNWDNGIFDENNGLRGTVVYRMKLMHRSDFKAFAAEARLDDTGRYIVKGMDVIDTVDNIVYIDCDAEGAHLETDVNSFFMAYRFHFRGEDYDKKTGIDGVVNTPLESLSVNLPLGSTVECKAYVYGTHVATENVFITHNSGVGEYDDLYLTSVNDYTWNY